MIVILFIKIFSLFLSKDYICYFFVFLQKQLFHLSKIITYCLLIIFSLAYSYETIKYFSTTIGDTSICWLDNFDCEEKSSESEESNKENEKLNFSEDLLLNHKNLYNNLIACYIESSNKGFNQSINFSSSNYSLQVYSPPEML